MRRRAVVVRQGPSNYLARTHLLIHIPCSNKVCKPRSAWPRRRYGHSRLSRVSGYEGHKNALKREEIGTIGDVDVGHARASIRGFAASERCRQSSA